jgi:S1-C subfamily serine protease
MNLIRSFILLPALLLAGVLSPSRSAFAMGAFETTGNVRWVVFASRQNVDEAIGLARRFGSEFGSPMVFSSTSGWYAIVAGPLSVYDPTALKKKLANLWWPPKDTSLARGQTLVEEVWKAPGSPVLATASSATGTHLASVQGLDVRVNTRREISVRTSGHEMMNVKFEDDGPNTSSAVQIVQLDNSSPFPQVVATHFTGGAHCCTLMKVLTFVGDRWTTINVGEFDSEGPQIEDLLGNGSAELVGKDESFDYAFASYAESYAPPKILRLARDRILDVSHSPEFRRPIIQMLLADQGLATPDMWRDNGYLAGWVAHSALVGNGAEAWNRMLSLYDRNSDWDLSTCAVVTKNDDPCPEYAKRQRDFPTALREHLGRTGYSLDGIASALVGTTSPSFDCNKAHTPSEIQICRSPRLAELDNILAAGYAYIKTTQGRPAADEIGVWYWKLIGHCEGDEDCIVRRQTEEITALARAGAPVSLPSWVSAPAPSEQQPTIPPSPPAPEAAKTVDEPTPPAKQDAETTAGTGFFVTSDGAIVTNAHVVENCSDIRVTTDQRAMAVAKVIARDSRNDLALLSSTLTTKKPAAFRTSMRLGEGIEAFGYPLTDVLAKAGNFTLGNVSALVGMGEDSRYLQISAPVQPGNSGGPLLDQYGNVVGVVSAKLNALKLMLVTNGDIAQNVNFAIRASIVTSFLDANSVVYATGSATQSLQSADLADQAKAISAFIECRSTHEPN